MHMATATEDVRQKTTTVSGILAILEREHARFCTGSIASDGVRAGDSTQEPVFRDGKLSGFVRRLAREAPTSPAATADDMETHSRLRQTLMQQLRLHSGRVGVTVDRGVVHLFGQADGSHAILAARRVAAAAPGTAAIIDDLWIDCE